MAALDPWLSIACVYHYLYCRLILLNWVNVLNYCGTTWSTLLCSSCVVLTKHEILDTQVNELCNILIVWLYASWRNVAMHGAKDACTNWTEPTKKQCWIGLNSFLAGPSLPKYMWKWFNLGTAEIDGPFFVFQPPFTHRLGTRWGGPAQDHTRPAKELEWDWQARKLTWCNQ